MRILTLLLVYFIWGTTYLAVKTGLETLPPFLLVGLRLILAGVILYAYRRPKVGTLPDAFHWIRGTGIGFLLFVCGTGVVVWSVQTVPTGLAAVLISTMPVWLTIFEAREKNEKLEPRVLTGLVLGLVGVALLLGNLGELVGDTPPVAGITALLFGAACWAQGSLRSRSSQLFPDGTMSVAIQMLSAGLILTSIGLARGEGIWLQDVSLSSGLAFAYLTIFGSLVGFSAYMWLLRNCSARLASTYAYVNPVVALIAGCVWGGESIGPKAILASLVILVGVGLMMTRGSTPKPKVTLLRPRNPTDKIAA